MGPHRQEPESRLRSVDVPLATTFMLSTKAGKETYVEAVIEEGGYRFTVKVGKPKEAGRLRTVPSSREAQTSNA